MKVRFVLLAFASAVSAIGQRSGSAQALPAGVSKVDFWTGAQGMLQVIVPVGTAPPAEVAFNLDFLTEDIAIIGGVPPGYDVNVSSSASADPYKATPTVVTYDAYFTRSDIKGDAWYDSFDFGGLSVAGQGFTFKRLPFWMEPSVMGMALSASSTPDFENSPPIVKLWQQAQAANPIVSFAGVNHQGEMYMGGINFDNVTGPITNYSADLNDGRWSLALDDIKLGSYSLGYNGKLTVAFNSLYHMVPMSTFNLIRKLTGFNGPTYTQGSVTVASGDCLLGAPNLEFVIDGVDLTLTPGQYIISTADPNVCYLAVAGWSGPVPAGLAFTLGSSIFASGAYAVFNYANETFGLADLAP